METVLKSLIVGVLLSANLFAQKGKEMQFPQISFNRSFVDSSLNQDEALFELSFSAMGVSLNKKAKITFSCNGVVQTLHPDPNGNILVKVMPGKYLFYFFYNKNHHEIKTDSILIRPGHRTQMKVAFRTARTQIYTKKPVIYVYPKERMEVSIKLNLNGKLDFTYPKYDDGWTFTANPDGTIELGDVSDEAVAKSGQKHHYLFWDGTADLDINEINLNEGFVVNQVHLVAFFEEKLSAMGLNSHEIEDYITYWGPLMSKYENTYVHFMFTEEYDAIATLDVNPKPDNLFRVFMLWSEFTGADTAPLADQTLQSFTREGFTLVEWGGAHVEGLTDMIPNPTTRAR